MSVSGRRRFIESYERRMDQLVTHPVFGYRLSHRRVLEVQARLLSRVLRGYGEHVQYSVFRCELTRRNVVELEARLSSVIHHREDQVLFVDVGPADGRARDAFAAMEKKYAHAERVAIVV